MAQKFKYLHYGLGALLVFVGVKMLIEDIVGHLPVARLAGRDRRHAGRAVAERQAAAPRASPARRRRSRSAVASSGLGSHWAMSGRSSGVSSPKSLRKSGVVR